MIRQDLLSRAKIFAAACSFSAVMFLVGSTAAAQDPSDKNADEPPKAANAKTAKLERSLELRVTRVKDKTGKQSTFVTLGNVETRLNQLAENARPVFAEFEPDKAKRSTVSIVIRADRDTPAGDVQQVIKLAQAEGFEKFALRPIKRAAAAPAAAQLELLTNFDGKLAAIVFDRRNLGTGEVAIKKLRTLVVAQSDELKAPLSRLMFLVEEDLQHVEVIQVMEAITNIRMSDGKTRAVGVVGFAAMRNSPDLNAKVVTTRVLPSKKTSTVSVSIGSDDGLQKGKLLFVYRNDPKTGKPRYLGRVRVTGVTPDRAVGVLMPADENDSVKPGDDVATRIPKPPKQK